MRHVDNHCDKPLVVWLILNKRTEEALLLLAKNYRVNTPKLKIGLPKGRRKNVFGCYTPKDETISVLNSDVIGNPFVILHEFYHHLRTHSVDKQHKGTEKNANKFATEFLQAYETTKRTQSLG
jgi:Zn-dependent peptidase ImmA (M78 family)